MRAGAHWLIVQISFALALLQPAAGINSDFAPIFEQHSIVMLWIEPESGQILAANPAAAQFYGYGSEQLQRMSIQQLNTLSPEQVAQERRLAAEQGRNYFIFRHRLADGDVRTVEVQSQPYQLGDQWLLLSMIQDITPGRNLEQGLWHYQNRLEELVEQRTLRLQTQQRWLMLALCLSGLLVAGLLFAALRLKQAQRALQEVRDTNEQQLRFLEQAEQVAGVGHWVIDVASGELEWSKQIYRLFGLPSQTPLSNQDFLQLIHPEDRQLVHSAWQQALEQKGLYEIEHRVLIDEQEIWVLERADLSAQTSGKILGTVLDISLRKHQELQLSLAASVFDNAREGIFITDKQGAIIKVNQSVSEITGYAGTDLIGRNPRVFSSGKQDPLFYQRLWQQLLDQGYWQGELWNRKKNGEPYHQRLTISAVHDPKGQCQHYIALFTDTTELQLKRQQLEHLAHYDALTSLPNRLLLADRLQHAIQQSKRRKNQMAVVYLDLDGFKEVNDQYGHDAGDQLLMIIAQRLQALIREGDTLARLGGDEFVVLLADLDKTEQCIPALERLLMAAAEPIEVNDLVLQVTASIGVSFWPQQQEVDADKLVRQADLAMYQAKQQGHNRYALFDHQQDTLVRDQHESLALIRQGLEANEFVLFYQPKVNMRSGEVIGVEALIRWQHPDKGLLSPACFMPLIEHHHLSIEIGDWVIKTAMAQQEVWQAHGLNLNMSVNVNAVQLQDPRLTEKLRLGLSQYRHYRAYSFELEILETSSLADQQASLCALTDCRQLGLSIAVDDFGTGFSSLEYLKKIPAHLIKIDQAFVKGMLENKDDLAILDGILGLAQAFNRSVIAEGVESLEHGDMLLSLGCELGQGYAIAKPMPGEQIPNWTQSWQVPDSWLNSKILGRPMLPLVFAFVEHRLWLKELKAYVEHQEGEPPALAHDQCKFGHWLTEHGADLIPECDQCVQVQSLHQQVHAKAVELINLRALELHQEVDLCLIELQQISSQMLKALKQCLNQG